MIPDRTRVLAVGRCVTVACCGVSHLVEVGTVPVTVGEEIMMETMSSDVGSTDAGADRLAVEVVEFRVDPAAEAQMLKDRRTAVAAIRAACDGVIDARLFRGTEAGVWIDVVFWRSLDDAMAGAEAVAGLPEAAAFMGHIEAPPVMRHGTLVEADLAT